MQPQLIGCDQVTLGEVEEVFAAPDGVPPVHTNRAYHGISRIPYIIRHTKLQVKSHAYNVAT